MRKSSDEFDDKTKALAFARCSAHCELCTRALKAKEARYDHVIPVALGGKPTLKNCQVLCIDCHAKKTGVEDVPRIKKAQRNALKRAGVKVKGAGGGKRQAPPCVGLTQIQRMFYSE